MIEDRGWFRSDKDMHGVRRYASLKMRTPQSSRTSLPSSPALRQSKSPPLPTSLPSFLPSFSAIAELRSHLRRLHEKSYQPTNELASGAHGGDDNDEHVVALCSSGSHFAFFAPLSLGALFADRDGFMVV